ncbi:MAG TPA: NnrU family protein [Aggregatilineales bacterium]|nr:NnrU family protein [Aggregatilineales bacterium]
MITLVIGLVLFLGPHSVSILDESWRDRMVARLGERPWKSVYSLVSLIGFVLIIRGFAAARHDVPTLYLPPASHLTALLMVPVFPLLIATYFPGKIQAVVRHPMLLAVILWAAAHLLANGLLADVLLFGGFLLWAVADLASMTYRTQRPIRRAPASRWNDAVAVIGGLVLYAVFVAGMHRWLFGITALV